MSAAKCDLPCGRDPPHRPRMKAFPPQPKLTQRYQPGLVRDALTEWRKLADFGATSLVLVQLHTGRTHQIRVHFSATKHPLVGDTLYGAKAHLHVDKTELPALGRQFLHAFKLGFPHPRTGQWLEASAPLPADLREFLHKLAVATGFGLDALSEYL